MNGRAVLAATVPTYRQTHDALRRHRGPASAHPCHWCGHRAAEWACLCADSSVTTGTNASGARVTYSPVLSEYVPACRSCHRRRDAARARESREESALAVSQLPVRRRPAVAPEPESVAAPPALFPVGWQGEATTLAPVLTGVQSAQRPSDAPSPRDDIRGYRTGERRQTPPPRLHPTPSRPHALPEVTA